MEKHVFKTVAFGGFDKQDVAGYIERVSREYTDHMERADQDRENLQKENQSLRERVRDLTAQTEEQSTQIEEFKTQIEELKTALEQAARKTEYLTGQQAEVETLRARLRELEPQSESYRQFRNRIGDIECDARRRAAEIEDATNEKLRRIADKVRERYQSMSATFGAASAGIAEELRKMEEGLSCIPQSLEQMGAELQSLDDTLQDR